MVFTKIKNNGIFNLRGLVIFHQDVDNQSTSDEFSGGGLISDDSSSDSSSSDSDDDRGLQLRAPKLRTSQVHHRRVDRTVVDSHHQPSTSKLTGHKPRLSSRAMSSSSDISSIRRSRRNETPTRKHGGQSAASLRYYVVSGAPKNPTRHIFYRL